MSVLPPLAKLYLREFFSNYFAENQRKEQLHAFLTGLEVLEEKLSEFQQKQLQWVDRLADSGDGVPMPTVIVPSPESQSDGLNVRFQSIYDRIKSLMQVEEIILERMSYETKRAELKPSVNLCEIIPENELYELVTEFREKNKQLKDQNESLRQQISQLTQNFNKCKQQSFEKDQQIIGVKNNLNRVEERRLELEGSLREKDIQLGTLLAQKVELIERIQKQQVKLEELKSQHCADQKAILTLKEQAMTEDYKVSKFNEFLEWKMADLRQQLLGDIKQTVANKENHNKAMLAVLKQVFIRPES